MPNTSNAYLFYQWKNKIDEPWEFGYVPYPYLEHFFSGVIEDENLIAAIIESQLGKVFEYDSVLYRCDVVNSDIVKVIKKVFLYLEENFLGFIDLEKLPIYSSPTTICMPIDIKIISNSVCSGWWDWKVVCMETTYNKAETYTSTTIEFPVWCSARTERDPIQDLHHFIQKLKKGENSILWVDEETSDIIFFACHDQNNIKLHIVRCMLNGNYCYDFIVDKELLITELVNIYDSFRLKDFSHDWL